MEEETTEISKNSILIVFGIVIILVVSAMGYVIYDNAYNTALKDFCGEETVLYNEVTHIYSCGNIPNLEEFKYKNLNISGLEEMT